jgi:hypothetical protein
MLRIEIVANHSVEENILEAFAQEQVGKYYTKYPNVFGVGSTGPRMGDAIWPEVNFSLVIWCDEDEARGIERAVAHVKEHFPDEGIKIFGLPEQVTQVVLPQVAIHSATAAAPHVAEAPVPAIASPAYQSGPAHEPSQPPVPAYTPPPAPGHVETEYDGQNMDEEH